MRITICFFTLLLITGTGLAQVGIGTNSPNASSVLDIQSADKAVLFPRMTTTQRNAIANPAAGMMVFNTYSACIEIFRGINWFNICSAGKTLFDGLVVPYMPAAVTKTVQKKVFVHLMPWYETPATNNGAWGIHWTMANRNPNTILPNGNREIASYYYPLTGPYASSDTALIDYQLLLMKLSGIDGVLIDWPGTGTNNGQNNDLPFNERNTRAIVQRLQKVGLRFALVYEDNFLSNVADKVAQARVDLRYADSVYFNQSNYEYTNGKPLLLVFGPQQLQSQALWSNVFSVLQQAPEFYTLWYESNEAGVNAAGEFAWIYFDYLTGLSNFYNNTNVTKKICSVYPGFKTFYAAGGWGGPGWQIDHNGAATFNATLDLALATSINYLQLNTWNDYGEGTMLEPTDTVNGGYGFQFLSILQQKLGVAGITQADLEAVLKLYTLRKSNASNAANLNVLNQVFYYFVSLQTAKARALLSTVSP